MAASIFVILVLFSVTGLIFYFAKKSKDNLDNNLQFITKILNSEIKQTSGKQRIVEGYYKERKIKIIFDSGYVFGSNHYAISITIFPRIVPEKQKGFSLVNPRPTKDTILSGKEIIYIYANLLMNRTCSEKDIIDIFEKLTQAAEVVEFNAPYYKK